MDAQSGSMTIRQRVTVRNKNGLHARPSSVLAETALRFDCTSISIKRGELEVDAKSIMELLLLEASCDTELTLVAAGPRAQEAIDELVSLFDREFDLRL
ncbi:MAG: HPr family phosphocarrier protein [Planctomycetota bacterium]